MVARQQIRDFNHPRPAMRECKALRFRVCGLGFKVLALLQPPPAPTPECKALYYTANPCEPFQIITKLLRVAWHAVWCILLFNGSLLGLFASKGLREYKGLKSCKALPTL